MSDISIALNREQIARCESLIRPYVRRTPIIQIDGADVGVNPRELCLKLELFQHSGSFKARGAFTQIFSFVKSRRRALPPRRVATTERRSPMRQ
jgi:threonine dehydratase